MSVKFRHLEKVVGLFMTIGILVLLSAVIFMGREQKWFDTKVQLHTVFDNGESLEKGMDVKINGLVVGKVTGVAFDTNNKIEVDFYVYDEFLEKVRSDSYVFKESSSPLGGGYLSLTIGSRQEAKAKENGILLSQDSPRVKDLIDNDMIPDRKSSFEKIIKDVQLLTSQLSSPRGPLIGSLLNVRSLTEKLASDGNSLTALMSDRSQLYGELMRTITAVRKIGDDLSILSAALRDSAPNVRNVIRGAETGLHETTRVMVGLQRYLAVEPEQKAADTQGSGSSLAPARMDRRQQDY
jgi:phospholipid/cholesterol/gamma-HCH transport system substrate-binding protein